jgi:predicted nucleic acid-binding protein
METKRHVQPVDIRSKSRGFNGLAFLPPIIVRKIVSGVSRLLGEPTSFPSIAKRPTNGLSRSFLSFHYFDVLPTDHVQAARFFKVCRWHGITGSHVDMLICALAYRYDLPIFTTDPDFSGYARHLPIRLLHNPERGGNPSAMPRPNGETPLPSGGRAVPSGETSVSIGERSLPAGTALSPSGTTLVPVGDRSSPIRERRLPVGGGSLPVHRASPSSA